VVRDRVEFVWRAFQRGLPSLWWVIGLIALLLGGSVLAYVAFALDSPAVAAAILGAGVLLAVAEGAFQLHQSAEDKRAGAEQRLKDFEEGAPQLSFGKVDIPRNSQVLRAPDSAGQLRRVPARGRVIRVPVTNAQGAGEARKFMRACVSSLEAPGPTTLSSRPHLPRVNGSGKAVPRLRSISRGTAARASSTWLW
jgi:hypothetical protein